MTKPRHPSSGRLEERRYSRPEVALLPDPLEEWTASIVRNAAVGALVRHGEQTRHLPKSFVASQPQVRFADMIGMRTTLADKFWKVSWQTVWTAVVLSRQNTRRSTSR